jgi:hypothetical protein
MTQLRTAPNKNSRRRREYDQQLVRLRSVYIEKIERSNKEACMSKRRPRRTLAKHSFLRRGTQTRKISRRNNDTIRNQPLHHHHPHPSIKHQRLFVLSTLDRVYCHIISALRSHNPFEQLLKQSASTMCTVKQDMVPQTSEEIQERSTPEAYPAFVAVANDPKRPTNEYVLVCTARVCLSLCCDLLFSVLIALTQSFLSCRMSPFYPFYYLPPCNYSLP